MLGNKAKRPANRYTGYATIQYHRIDDNRTTDSAQLARKWYDNGNRVAVVAVAHVFQIPRNTARVWMNETDTCTVLKTVHKKTGYLWDDKLNAQIAKRLGHEVNYNLF